MAKHPKRNHSPKKRTGNNLAESIPALFPHITEEIKKFLSKHGHNETNPTESFEEIVAYCQEVPEYILIDATQTTIKLSLILDFLKNLLCVTFMNEEEINDEEILGLMKQVLPFIEFIQYSINMDIGNDYSKVLDGQERVIFSSRVMEDWLLLLFILLILTIRQFIGMGKPIEWFDDSELFRTSPIHFLVVLRHSDNRRRYAFRNGATDFTFSKIERGYMSMCCEFLTKGWKHKLLAPNYAHQRIYLETFYDIMDITTQSGFLKTFNFILQKTKKKGIRTIRALITRDFNEVKNLSYNDLVPTGHNQGLRSIKVIQKVFLFILATFPNIRDVDKDILPNLSQYLPLALTVLDWPDCHENIHVKDLAILVGGTLISLIDIPHEITGSYIDHLYRIKEATPHLLNYVSSKVSSLCWRSQHMCYRMVSQLAQINGCIDEEHLKALLEIYEPNMVGVGEFLDMIKVVWVNSKDTGQILRDFVMKWLREMVEMSILHEEMLPRMKMIVQFFNRLSLNIKHSLDPVEILTLMMRKIVEFLDKGGITNYNPDFEITNSFCKILIFFADHIEDLEGIYTVLHNLITACIIADPILKEKPVSDLSTSITDYFGKLSKHEDGNFLDLIRALHIRGLLVKCCKQKQDTDDSNEFIYDFIVPYLVDYSIHTNSHISEQATWALLSILVTDMHSSQRLVLTMKKLIDDCQYLRIPEQFSIFQRGYYKGLLGIAILLFSFYPEEMAELLLPHYDTLFNSPPTTTETAHFFPLLYNQTLLVAEYMLDHELLCQSPEMLLSLQVLFSYIFGLSMKNTHSCILIRRVITKFEIAVRDYSSD